MAHPIEFKTALETLRHRFHQRSHFNIAAAFNEDISRFKKFSLSLDDLLLDFSKTALDEEICALLENLARTAGIEPRRNAMFAGEPINETEHRPALHVALRALPSDEIWLGGHNIIADVHAMLDEMETFSTAIRNGQLRGANGDVFTDIVNIGIGGSDLGPKLATQALKPYHNGPKVHFVSNVDSADIADHLANLNPSTTLIIIVSKTFTTVETMSNAAIARQWIVENLGETSVNDHFVAVSTAQGKVLDFGINRNRIFGFWNWVGGRLSVWSAVGLSLMLAIGAPSFRAFLSGARLMDEHFLNAPLRENLPVMLGLIGFFHRVICAYPTRAIIPYEQRLHHIPAYLQQLDMESNGKRICLDGTLSALPTAPIVWGDAGTNAQHAFFQLLHQGSDIVPVEFIACAQGHEHHLTNAHHMLVANCLAQAQALMIGKTEAKAERELLQAGFSAQQATKLAPHRTFPGNRPSIILLQDKLTPYSLGRLLALYEHRIFVEGILLDINSFDQWGVELGKQLANEILPMLTGDRKISTCDGSTSGLLAYLRQRTTLS